MRKKAQFYLGQRLTLWLWNCRNPQPLVSSLSGADLLRRLCDALNMRSSSDCRPDYVPGPGYSLWLPIYTSHLILETWPEVKAACLDIVSCAPFDVDLAKKIAIDFFHAGLIYEETSGGPGGFFDPKCDGKSTNWFVEDST